MRVIAGELGGRVLQAPDGLETRPTTDRVREAVFNSLNSMDVLIDADVVDLFAGTGALGIEALSRGAEHCWFVERDRRALDALRTNLAELGLEARATVVVADATTYVRTMKPCDLVLADPPYGFEAWTELLDGLPAALVVAESGRSIEPPFPWEIVREKRYGRTVVSFLEPG